MNTERQYKLNYFQTRLFSAEKYRALASSSNDSSSSAYMRLAASNYRDALMLLSSDTPNSFVEHLDSEEMADKVWQLYDECWIDSKNGMDKIINGEVDRVLKSKEKEGVRSFIKEVKSGLDMDVVGQMVCMLYKNICST